MKVGDRVPAFQLFDQHGELFSLEAVVGTGPLVIFFYPKDETAVCTQEACSFRDANQDFVAAGATVVGISSDDVASHQRFAAKHRLNYRLLADVGGKVRARLQVARSFFGLSDGRVTYVIDKGGVVRMVHQAALSAQAHVDQAIAVIQSLH